MKNQTFIMNKVFILCLCITTFANILYIRAPGHKTYTYIRLYANINTSAKTDTQARKLNEFKYSKLEHEYELY